MRLKGGIVKNITIAINGQELHIEEGTSILSAARANGIPIPALCYLEGLSVAGSCRLCFVEVEGLPRPVTACSVTAKDGMVIQTETEQLRNNRQFVLEMLFASGHHICAFCVSNGHCELQQLASENGVTSIPFPLRKEEASLDMSHERYGHDPNRCVLCTRCVRACEEISGKGLWAVVGRGSDAHLEINEGGVWGGSSKCTACGACVAACPTAALFDKQAAAGEMVKDCALLASIKAQREGIT
jgi:bidirectional [NiFe] hydrogenase diaphorase subunit